MSGYRDKPLSSVWREPMTAGVYAVRYGVGFVIYGILGLASGELPGLSDVRFLQQHHAFISVCFCVLGGLLLWWGWRNPE